MPKLDIYNLGAAGVNVDKDQIHLENNEFTSTQNLVPNIDGGITNRPGLVKFNSSAAGSGTALRGGVGVPFPNFGAPSDGTYYLATYNQSDLWYSVGNFTSSWTRVSTVPTTYDVDDIQISFSLTLPAAIDLTTELDSTQVSWVHPACFANNRLYYGAITSAFGLETPRLHVFDGSTDTELALIPYNPDLTTATSPCIITSVVSLDGTLYITTLDNNSSASGDDTTWRGRVFSADIDTGKLTQIGGSLPAGQIPLRLTLSQGVLYLGTRRKTRTNVGNVYKFKLNTDTAWASETALDAGRYAAPSLATYKGKIYVGTQGNTGTAGAVYERAIAGTWSVTDSGGQTVVLNGYLDLIVFRDNLYASYYSATSAATNLIRKFDGSSWSTVHSGFLNSGGGVTQFAIIGSTLYGIGSGSPATKVLLSTTDGTTWSATSITGAVSGIGPLFGTIVN